MKKSPHLTSPHLTSPHLTSRRGLPKILFAAMIALHIFGVKTNLLGQQPATCNCPGLTYAFDEVVIGGNLPDFPGPFNVRLYVIFLKDPNLQNGGFVDPIAERFDLIMSNLSDVFNPQNIFFQPGFGNPCGGTDNYLEMNAPSSGTNQEAMVGFHQANIASNVTYANGLTLYIMHDQVSGAGFEFSTPSTFCMVSGVFNGELGSKTSIVAHEIGHCLGLLHTFQQCTGPTTSCYYTGDLVCETPWTDQTDDITGNTDCPPANPQSPNWQNIMSYFYPASCRSEFTAEQGKRMRYYLHEKIGEGLGELGNVGADIHITTNTTWSTAQVVQGNIFVENNSTLTVNAKVEMQENNMIFVERGSQLIVRNTITNTCGKFWKGVVVDGNHILPQNSGQGRVLMNAPGVIENALCAVRLGGFEVDPNSGTNESTGGIFTATGGTLRNNVVGVQFLPYVKEDSKSVLSGCAFVTDHQYYGKNPVFHAKMNLIYGVKFNCAFRDDRVASYSNPNTRARGIEAKNATFKVLGLSHFKNLYRAIDAARVKNPASPNVVEGASFEGCFTGIHFFNNYKYSLTGNEFSILPPAAFTGTALMTGVKLDGMGAITFNGNSFSSSIEYVDFVGVDCYSLGESENEIKENSFSDIWIANRANGGNGGQTGLQYLCNTNSGNNHDFWVTGGSAIRAVQGEEMGQFNNIPAGNTFSHLDFDFRNDGTLKPITYVYKDNPVDPNDDNQRPRTGWTPLEVRLVEETVNAPDCELPGCPPPCYEEGRLEDWKDDFWTAKQTWTSLRNQLPTITDSAARAATIRDINAQRRNMDIHGQNVLGHYMLDSLVSRPDSVFAWLSNLETYGADWHLVQHHFFSENLALADSLMGIMPGKHDLDSDEITRHANSEDLLNLLRDEVEAGTDLTSFPENLVEALYEYETDCYAAGALARALLMLNDREPAAPDCASAEVRPANTSKVDAANALKVYPNPAKDVVNIKVGGLGNSIHQIDLVDMGGRTRLRKSCPAGQTQCEVGLTDLPAGIYLVKATLSTGKTSLQKLTIHR